MWGSDGQSIELFRSEARVAAVDIGQEAGYSLRRFIVSSYELLPAAKRN
jgi:hypothetical protein